MTFDPRLDILLDQWEAARERGETLSPQSLCKSCPELEREMARRIQAMKLTQWMVEPDTEDHLACLPLPSEEAISAGVLVPASVTLDQFTANLKASRVLRDDEIGRYKAVSAEDMVAQLLREEKLTKYQVRQIGNGNAQRLVLGNYVILDKIGAGGMGQVLKARHVRMDRIVALKVLQGKSVDSPHAVERFQREARAAAKLEHRNIVTAYDANEFEGQHFFVMQFVSGADLHSIVSRSGPMPIGTAVDCVIQAAQGLAYAHGERVIHRDIKPANLLLDKNGVVKILDMGLARIEATPSSGFAKTQSQLTQDGGVMGTVDFMSPEQALETRNADARSDVYSLGCTLYYLLTGKPVYEGSSLMAKMLAHREAEIPSLSEQRRDIPAELSAIFKRMVAKQASDRYQTMGELIDDLERFVREVSKTEADPEPITTDSPVDIASIETSRASLDETIEVVRESRADDEESLQPITERARYSRGVWLVGFLATLFAAGGWLYFAEILFQFETADGLIRIESNVTGIEVYVDDKKIVTIPDPKDKRSVTVRIPTGGKILRVTKESFEADTPEFVLNSVHGFVKVTFVPKVTLMPKVTSAITPARHRAVAEYVIGRGGWVRVRSVASIDVSVSELPDIVDAKEIPEGDIQVVSVFPGSHGVDETFNWISLTPPPLEAISASGTDITDAGLSCFSAFPSLSVVEIQRTKVTDDGLRHLRGLPLTSFSGGQNGHWSDEALRYLGQHPQLRELYIGAPVTDSGIAHLANLVNLENLHIESTELTDSSLRHLADFDKLENLNLRHSSISGVGFSDLRGRLPKLKGANLNDTKVSDEGMIAIAEFVRSRANSSNYDLDNLDLSNTSVTDLGMAKLAGLRIGDLRLSQTSISDVGILSLATSGKISDLHVDETNVSTEGLLEFYRRHKCNLYYDDRLAAEFVVGKNGKVHIRWLDSNVEVTASSLDELPSSAREDGPFVVLEIDLGEADFDDTTLTSGELKRFLPRLAGLKTLRLQQSKVTPASIAALREALPDCEVIAEGNANRLPVTVAMSEWALVRRPAKLEGVESWTIETRGPRDSVHRKVIAYSPNGRWLAASGDDATRIWDAKTYKLQQVLVGPREAYPINPLKWMPDSRQMILSRLDGVYQIWDAVSGQLLETSKMGGIGQLSTNGLLATEIEGGAVRVSSFSTGEAKETLPFKHFSYFAWSPDASMLAGVVKSDEEIRLVVWSIAEHAVIHEMVMGPPFEQSDLHWSPDNESICIIGHDKSISIWSVNAQTITEISPALIGNPVAVAWSLDSRRIAFSQDYDIRVWDATSKQSRNFFEGDDVVQNIAWSPDSSEIAVALATSIEILDANSAGPIQSIGGHSGIGYPYAPNALPGLSVGKQLDVWHRRDQAFPAPADYDVAAWSPDGRLIATYSNVGLEIWEAKTLQRVANVNLDGNAVTNTSGRHNIAWSADSHNVAICLPSQVFIWNDKSADVVAPHASQMNALAWSHKGDRLATANRSEIRLFEVSTGMSQPAIKTGADVIAFSSDGQYLASAFEGVVHLWDADGKFVDKIVVGNAMIRSLGWLPDGSTLICGCNDRTVMRLSTKSGELIGNAIGEQAELVPYQTVTSELADDLTLIAHRNLTTSFISESLTGKPLLTFSILRDDHHVVISPEGHFRGSPHVERLLVYVVQTLNGQETLSPDDFKSKYGWVNDPSQVPGG